MTEIAPAVEALAKLRAPFPPNQVSKLPKETRAQIDARKNDKSLMLWKCDLCGGAHHKNAVHLDYVGHAALTDRLLDTDIEWTWEPVAFGPDGLPALDRNGGLWIRLTVCGVTRLGYGAADGKAGGDAIKEIIGDALRNAAMRFGAALDLWHKGDLHADETHGDSGGADNALIDDHQWATLIQLSEAAHVSAARICKHFDISDLRHLPAARFGEASTMLSATIAKLAEKKHAKPVEDVLEAEVPY